MSDLNMLSLCGVNLVAKNYLSNEGKNEYYFSVTW